MAISRTAIRQQHGKLRPKLLFVGGLALLVLLVTNFSRAWSQSQQINREIAGLQSELQKTEQKNVELTELISYLNSQAYIEEKARNDLGLKREGERVVVIPQEALKAAVAVGSGQGNEFGVATTQNPSNNLAKWLRLFFGK